MKEHSNYSKYISTVLVVYVAFVFIQSLFFKFTGSYETVYIFGTLGQWMSTFLPKALANGFENFGAYVIGSAELVASLMVLVTIIKVRLLGAVLGMGIMSGAIFFHLFTPLGVKMPEFNELGQIVGDDGGLLFTMACFVWLSCLCLIVINFKTINKIK